MTAPPATFDGAPLAGEPGQSVGAALIAAGITSWRTTRRGGRPRGIFCGIGLTLARERLLPRWALGIGVAVLAGVVIRSA